MDEMGEFLDDNIITLTDEDGVNTEFKFIIKCTIDDIDYYAFSPQNESPESKNLNNGEEEYVILKLEEDDDGEPVYVTIDNDEEFDRVADIIEDELFSEIDYDEDDGENEYNN